MEINGLPLHPLVVHAAVVLGPIAALVALAYAARPDWRERLRKSLVVLAVLSVGSIVAAYLTGDQFKGANAFFEKNELVEEHEELAGLLLWVTIGFGVVTLLTVFLHKQTGGLRIALHVLLAASAIAVLVLVVMTGEAGARAVWGTGNG